MRCFPKKPSAKCRIAGYYITLKETVLGKTPLKDQCLLFAHVGAVYGFFGVEGLDGTLFVLGIICESLFLRYRNHYEKHTPENGGEI